MSNFIFVPTIPQSGTWFILKFLEKCGLKLEHVGEILRRTDNRTLDLKGVPTVLSTHIFPFYYQGNPYKEAWPTYGGDPIQDYVVRKYCISLGAIELLASIYKTVIPIRDPLACLLTREVRAGQLRHFYIIDGFIEVAERFMNHPNVKFFPIDLYGSDSEPKTLEEEVIKKKSLISLLEHCEIDVESNKTIINDTAKCWKRENETPNNRYKAPYEAGDIEKIKKMLGSKWAEVEYLKNHASRILPLLTSLGYTTIKPLLW